MVQHSAYFLQIFLNIVQLASFYAPLAVAFSLIQAITRRVFLSLGDFAMFGSFAAVYVCFGRLLQGDDDWQAASISLLLAVLCAGALGKVTAKYVFAPMVKSSALAFMIAAIGFSIAIEELMRLITESRDIWIPPLFQGQVMNLVDGDFPVHLSGNYAFASLISALSIAAVFILVQFTHFGRKWQACSENLTLAKLCGVKTETIIQQTFIVGAALSAVSGWMTAITYGGTNFSVGIMLGFKAMFAAVAGGFGNMRGAVVGAISLAVLEVVWSAGFGTTYRDVGVFSAVVLVLLFRPEGLGGIRDMRESES